MYCFLGFGWDELKSALFVLINTLLSAEWLVSCLWNNIWGPNIFLQRLFIQICLPQTSVAVASTIYQISKNPDKQQQLFEELRSIMPTKSSVIDTATLERMPYLRACIKETLRYINECFLKQNLINFAFYYWDQNVSGRYWKRPKFAIGRNHKRIPRAQRDACDIPAFCRF